MLKKLFKYEWRSVSTLLFIVHGVLLIYALIGRIGYQIYFSRFVSDSGNTVMGITTMFYVIVYVFGIMAVLLMTMLYLAMHIQKSFFSDEGYLTHTLPVSPTQLLLSKMFIYWIWTILDIIFVVISIGILLINKETWPAFTHVFREMWNTLSSLSGFSNVVNNIIYLLSLFVDFFCFSTGLLIFAICLGSQFKTHKVMGSVLSFFGIVIISNIVNLIITGATLPGGIGSTLMVTSAASEVSTAINYSYIAQTIWYLLAGIFFFLGSRYILSKKLNLE